MTAAASNSRVDAGQARRASVRIPFAAIVLAMLPAVLDQTILATALPTIARDLGRVSDVSWIVTTYVVGAAAATPRWGKLGDRYGRSRLLQLSLGGFLAASAVCGVSQSLVMLLVVRGVQGVAAGGLMTLAMASVGDLVSPRERARYQGIIAAVFAGATVLGPLVGGVLVQDAGWRWVFYVNLPVGILALAALRLRLPPSPGEGARLPLDLCGSALLVLATSGLMLTCVLGGSGRSWTSPLVLSLTATAVVATVGLIARERCAPDPVVPLDVLRLRPVAVACATFFLATAGLFAITVFVPLFLQTTTGASPTLAGLLLVPMMIGVTVSTNLAGRAIGRSGRYKRYPVAGLALMTAGLVILAACALDPSRSVTGIGLAVFGLGFGLVGQVLMVAVQNSVDRSRLGVATASTNLFRALGGAIGSAVLGAVFAARVGHGSPAEIESAARTVFLAGAGLTALAFLVVLLLEEVPLRGPAAPPRDAEDSSAQPELSRR
jgi:EmrB/QacA subfamily drug resistance transporter